MANTLSFLIGPTLALAMSCVSISSETKSHASESTFRRNSAGQPYSIQTVAAPIREGQTAFRFELRKGEQYRSRRGSLTYRSEIDTNDYVASGSTQWYGISVFIPKDFPIEKNRLVIGQWYADSDEGEISRSPAMAQRFVNGRFYVTVRHSAVRVQKTDGQEETIYQTDDLKLGQWNDFVYQVKWSYLEDGFVHMWLNAQQVAHYKGPTGYNDEKGPEFNFGIYRDASDSTYIMYFANYRRGSSFEEVDPARQHSPEIP